MWDLRPGAPRGELLRGRPGDWVEKIAITELDGTPVAVTGGGITVEIWDLRTGEKRRYKESRLRTVLNRLRLSRRSWFESRRGISSMAIGEVDGAPLAVTGNNQGTVRVWDLRAGKPRGGPLRGHADWVSRVAAGLVDGTPVAVTGDTKGMIRVWDLRAGKARGGPLRAHGGKVTAVAVGQADDTPLAIIGSDDGTVRVWDLRARKPRGGPLRGHDGWVGAIAIGEFDGNPVMVSGDENGTILMRDLNSTQHVVARLNIPSGIKQIVFGNSSCWLTATYDGSLFTWRPAVNPGRASP
jgi:WD40 repeat protein